MCVYVYIHIYIYIHTHTRARAHAHTRTHTHIYYIKKGVIQFSDSNMRYVYGMLLMLQHNVLNFIKALQQSSLCPLRLPLMPLIGTF